MKKLRTSLVAATVVLGSALAVVLSAAPAEAAGYSYDGTYPGACATGSYQAQSEPITTISGGVSMGTAVVQYSPSCGTNWVRAYTSYSGYTVDKVITRTSPNYYSTTPEYDASPGWSYSPQVYAPGSTCVVAEVYLYPSGGGPFVASAVFAVC